MNLIIFEGLSLDSIISFIFSIKFVLIILTIIIFYHLLVFFLRDKKRMKILKMFNDSEEVNIEQLNEKPLVNFIIPAWKEGKLFEDCLNSIKNLKYPKKKIIVNAGGSEETTKIADSFKNYKEFVILRQKEGEGKMKAINDGIKLVNDGLVYIIDSDSYLSDQIFLKMISIIINENENVVTSITRPLKQQENKDLVKYININRNSRFKTNFKRFIEKISPHLCIRYNVLKSVGFLDEKKAVGDGRAGIVIFRKGYKIYEIANYKWYIYTYFPETIKIYFNQNIRWIENAFFFKIKHKRIRILTRFPTMFIISVYLIIFPCLILINVWFIIFGLLIILSMYLKKIRKVLFFKKSVDKKFQPKFTYKFYIKILFYIYIDLLMNIYTFFEILLFGNKKLKQRKNIQQ